MTVVLEIILFIVAAVLLGVTGGFVAKSAEATTDITGYSSDSQLQKAHEYLSYSAVTSWVGIAVIILLIILYAVFGSETARIHGRLCT